MQTTAQTEDPVIPLSLYAAAMHELAGLIGLEPAEILKTGSVEADGVRFYFQDHTDGEAPALGVLAEIGEIPAEAESDVHRQLLEANSHLSPQAGAYALVPGTNRAALRMQVQVEEGAPNGERVLNVLKEHLATCTAVRHLGTQPGFESGADMINLALA